MSAQKASIIVPSAKGVPSEPSTRNRPVKGRVIVERTQSDHSSQKPLREKQSPIRDNTTRRIDKNTNVAKKQITHRQNHKQKGSKDTQVPHAMEPTKKQNIQSAKQLRREASIQTLSRKYFV